MNETKKLKRGSKALQKKMKLAMHKYSKPVCQKNIYTNVVIKVFSSLHDASRVTKVNRKGIRDCANGKTSRGGLFLWSWYNKEEV